MSPRVGSCTRTVLLSLSTRVGYYSFEGYYLFEGGVYLTTIVLGSSSLSLSLSSSVSETSCDVSCLNGRGFTSSNCKIAARIVFI